MQTSSSASSGRVVFLAQPYPLEVRRNVRLDDSTNLSTLGESYLVA